MNPLVLTCGDINGIGPEICVKTINKLYEANTQQIIFTCPAIVFESTASLVPPIFNYNIVKKLPSTFDPETVLIFDIGYFQQDYGCPTKSSGGAAFNAIKESFQLVNKKNAGSIVTAPISKLAFKLAGKNYPGQTELLAEMCRSENFLMTFLSEELICGLTTIHEPIKNIAKLINKVRVANSIKILFKSLISDLGIKNPSLAVLGLNPHAGENGKIGKEEIESIAPAIKSVKNISVHGPFVPDAFFGSQLYKKFSAVLGMYHDQVLIPFKLLNFNTGVNFTAGLRVVRTSPDHGTGYDIAGKGIANPSSMIEAVKWANRINANRLAKKNES